MIDDDERVSDEVAAQAKKLMRDLMRYFGARDLDEEVVAQALEMILAYLSGGEEESLDAMCANLREWGAEHKNRGPTQ